ncbi:MAG TPA: hypothetical protein VKB34_04545, partial [Povalibacter sp.]|nr:hypothetical protein [Povalibacter sp.]
SEIHLPDGSAFDPHTQTLPSEFVTTWLRPDLFGEDAVTRLRVFANGEFKLPATTVLNLPGGSSVQVTAGRVDVQGSVRSPGGTVELGSTPTTTYTASSEQTQPRTIVDGNARLDVSGIWVNEQELDNTHDMTTPLFINGGRIAVSSRDGAVSLGEHTVLDVSGGARSLLSGQVIAGSAGSISIAATPSVIETITPITLAGELRGYGLTNGGSLSLATNTVCITATTCASEDDGETATEESQAAVLHLSPEFFTVGGFSSYAVTSNSADLQVAAGTHVVLQQQNFELDAGAGRAASGARLSDIAHLVDLPDHLRKPVSLSLTANIVRNLAGFQRYADVVIGEGAVVQTDPGATVKLESNSHILLQGSILAPAGRVSMVLNNTLSGDDYHANQGIWLAGTSVIDVDGTTVLRPKDDLGHVLGQLLGGGTIDLDARRGYIVTGTGSLMSASGAAQSFDVQSNGIFHAQDLCSDAGTIRLKAAEGMLLYGDLRAQAPTPEARGGTVEVTLDVSGREDSGLGPNSRFTAVSGPRNIRVTEESAPIAIEALSDIPDRFNGMALLPVDKLNASGADFVTLTARNINKNALFPPQPTAFGQISFDGVVSLHPRASLQLQAAQIGVTSGSEATLGAAVVTFGIAPGAGESAAPVPMQGTGVLRADAQLLQFNGSVDFVGLDQAQLRSSGDLRFIGTYDVNARSYRSSVRLAGDAELVAQQVYPSTLTEATVTALGGDLSLSSPAPGAASADVLSAGGKITLNAARVNIDTQMRAPFGSIAVNAESIDVADHGVLSTSTDRTIPFGRLQGDFAWVYELQGFTRVMLDADGSKLPEQAVRLTADNISLAPHGVIDIDGGGDLLAFEFQPGPGGKRDVLSAEQNPNLFAIVPGLNATFAPYDPREYIGSSLRAGDSIHLDGAAGGPPAGD